MACASGPGADAWALGGLVHSVDRALRRGGSGFWVFGGGLACKHVCHLAAEMAGIRSEQLEVIGNTTSAATAARLGARGDHARRQLPLSEDGYELVADAVIHAAGRSASQLPGVMAGLEAIHELAKVLGGVLGISYHSVFPVLLRSLPGAAQQRPHTDLREWWRVGDEPQVLGALLSFMPGTSLPVWPGPRLARGSCRLGEGVVLHLPPGCVVVFRGDAIHAGAANLSAMEHWRLHAYLVASPFADTATGELDLEALLDTGFLDLVSK